MTEIKVAMIGFGGIARTHYAGYQNFKKEGFKNKFNNNREIKL